MTQDTASPRTDELSISRGVRVPAERTRSEADYRRERAANFGVSEALVAESDAAMANGKLLCGLLDAFGGGLK